MKNFEPDDSTADSPEEVEEGAELISQLEQEIGSNCRSCGQPLCVHQLLANFALGLKAAPRCLECTAARLEQSPAQLSASVLAYFKGRACYRAAWHWASTQVDGAGECCRLISEGSKEL